VTDELSESEEVQQFRKFLQGLVIDHRPLKYRGTSEQLSVSRFERSRETMEKMFSGESPESVAKWHKEFMKQEHVLTREKAMRDARMKQTEPTGLGYLLGVIGEARRFAHMADEFALLERTLIDEIIDRIENFDADYFEAVAGLLRQAKSSVSSIDGPGFDCEWATIEKQKLLPEEESWLKRAGPEAGSVMFFFCFGREFQKMPTIREIDTFLRRTYSLAGDDSARRVRKTVGLSGLPRAR